MAHDKNRSGWELAGACLAIIVGIFSGLFVLADKNVHKVEPAAGPLPTPSVIIDERRSIERAQSAPPENGHAVPDELNGRVRGREDAWRRDSVFLSVLEAHASADSARAAELARDRQALRDTLRARLDSAGIAFNSPERMQLEKPVSIHLVLNPAAGPNDSLLVKALVAEPDGPRRYDRVPVAAYAEARLTGAKFEIQPVNLSRQSIGRTTQTEWRWVVTPKEGGTQKLYLALEALMPEEEAPIYSYTRNYQIVVQVSAISRIVGWLNSQLAWLIPLLLSAPVIAFLRQRLKHTRRNTDSLVPAEKVTVQLDVPVSPVRVPESSELTEAGKGGQRSSAM